MEDRLLSIFAEGLGLEPAGLSDETNPENTPEWDSLAAMELVALLEETFEIELSTEEIMSMRSIGIVREVLRAKGVGPILHVAQSLEPRKQLLAHIRQRIPRALVRP